MSASSSGSNFSVWRGPELPQPHDQRFWSSDVGEAGKPFGQSDLGEMAATDKPKPISRNQLAHSLVSGRFAIRKLCGEDDCKIGVYPPRFTEDSPALSDVQTNAVIDNILTRKQNFQKRCSPYIYYCWNGGVFNSDANLLRTEAELSEAQRTNAMANFVENATVTIRPQMVGRYPNCHPAAAPPGDCLPLLVTQESLEMDPHLGDATPLGSTVPSGVAVDEVNDRFDRFLHGALGFEAPVADRPVHSLPVLPFNQTNLNFTVGVSAGSATASVSGSVALAATLLAMAGWLHTGGD